VLAHGICIDTEDRDVVLGRSRDDEPYFRQIMLRVLPCSLPAGCASQEELVQLVFATNIPKPIPHFSNKDHPIHYVTLPEEVTYLSAGLSGQQTLNLIKTEIVDDAGFIQGSRLSKAYTSVENTRYNIAIRNASIISCSKEQIAQMTCPHYWQQTMLTSSKKIVIKRQYKGMVETFSELGGIIEMLFMLFFFPYTIYNNRLLKEKLIEIVYDVRKPEKPHKRRCLPCILQRDLSKIDNHYHVRMKEYQRLFESIETCLDVVSLYKEVKNIISTLKSNGMTPTPTRNEDPDLNKQVLLQFDPPNSSLPPSTMRSPRIEDGFQSHAEGCSRRMIATNSIKSIKEQHLSHKPVKKKSSLLASKVSPRRLMTTFANPKQPTLDVNITNDRHHAVVELRAGESNRLRVSRSTLQEPL